MIYNVRYHRVSENCKYKVYSNSELFFANPRHQRQIELKLMHDAGMRREYEKAAKLLETLMNYKRR